MTPEPPSKLQTALGAESSVSVQKLTLYISNTDKDRNAISDVRNWIEEARDLLTVIGLGSTAHIDMEGTWLKDQSVETVADLEASRKTGDEPIIREKTTYIFTGIKADRFESNLNSLRSFLHRYGKNTQQGEVFFEFDGEFYRILNYD